MNPATELARLLSDHRAVLRRNAKHDVWQFPNGNTLTLSKTPGDLRAAANQLRDARRCLGLQGSGGQPGERRERRVKHERPERGFEPVTAPNTALRDALIAAGCTDADQLIARMDMATIGEILLSKGNVQAVTDLAAIKQQAPVQNNHKPARGPLTPPIRPPEQDAAPALPAPAGYRKQVCEDCRDEKVITDFQRLRNGEHAKSCKACHAEVVARAKREAAETKVCRKCGEKKLKSEFSKAAKAKDGLQSWCKACQRAVGAKRYADLVAAKQAAATFEIGPAPATGWWSRLKSWFVGKAA
jgi:hypothetical protein